MMSTTVQRAEAIVGVSSSGRITLSYGKSAWTCRPGPARGLRPLPAALRHGLRALVYGMGPWPRHVACVYMGLRLTSGRKECEDNPAPPPKPPPSPASGILTNPQFVTGHRRSFRILADVHRPKDHGGNTEYTSYCPRPERALGPPQAAPIRPGHPAMPLPCTAPTPRPRPLRRLAKMASPRPSGSGPGLLQ